MINVTTVIDAIILHCDDSVLGLHIGNGYTFKKTYIKDLTFKDKITDGRGQINISYFDSIMSDEGGEYFICLNKNSVYQIESPLSGPGIYTDKDLRCENQIDEHNHSETNYLHGIFSLLRLYKAGNIGTKEIFIENSFSIGILKNNLKCTSDNITRNITDERVFSLSEEELRECNQFLNDYSANAYSMIKNNIDEFVWGLDQVDDATGFEQYTTALEMTLLGHNQQGKKEVLSKRVAVMLETMNPDINNTYLRMKEFYRYRSESLHEGNGQNISRQELFEMEEIVRKVLKNCLNRCKTELSTTPTTTWTEIKIKIINELKGKVVLAETLGTF